MQAKGHRAEIIHDLSRARELFDSLGLDYSSAQSTWLMLLKQPTTFTRLKVTREDPLRLVEMTEAPRARLRAVLELERQDRSQVTERSLDWENLKGEVLLH